MTLKKRIFDVGLAIFAMIFFAIPGVLIAGLLLIRQGRPILYASERMKTPQQAFLLWKFRTMYQDHSDTGVSGGHKHNRITPMGRKLRRYRLDELPQLWNVLRGDLSFVGPRPPLKCYVDRFPQIYAQVLAGTPGITGLATLVFHAREEMLLAGCANASETDEVYSRRCIARKARLDIIYHKKRSLWLDTFLLLQTLAMLIQKLKVNLPALHQNGRKVKTPTTNFLN